MMTVKQLSKACAQVWAGYTVYFSPDNGTLIEIASLEVVNGNAILHPHYEERTPTHDTFLHTFAG